MPSWSILSLTQLYRYTPEIFLFSTATFKYKYRGSLRRIGQEYSAKVAFSIFQSLKRIHNLKRIQPLPVCAGFFICIRNSLDRPCVTMPSWSSPFKYKVSLWNTDNCVNADYKNMFNSKLLTFASLLQGNHLPFSPSPLRLNIFRLFVILSLTQLYRYTPETFLFSTATFKWKPKTSTSPFNYTSL
jgi:hypothetical protein